MMRKIMQCIFTSKFIEIYFIPIKGTSYFQKKQYERMPEKVRKYERI